MNDSSGPIWGARPHVRQPRVAELIADELRTEILSDGVADGDSLPKQEELAARFGVSQPSVREALSILESEGLVIVRRGARGGAVVRAPRPAVAAFMTALVLESQNTKLQDVGDALALLEPMCAKEAATAPGRSDLVAQLEAIQAATSDAVPDGPLFTSLARDFHDAIVQGCGSRSLSLVVGILESLWSAHERSWASRTAGEGRYATEPAMRAVLKTHARMLAAIKQGDGDEAAKIMRRHVEATQRLVLEDAKDHRVQVSTLGPTWMRS